MDETKYNGWTPLAVWGAPVMVGGDQIYQHKEKGYAIEREKTYLFGLSIDEQLQISFLLEHAARAEDRA